MRLVATLVVAIFVVSNALGQSNLQLPAMDDGNQAQVVLVAADDVSVCYWPMGLSCDLDEPVNNMRLGQEDKCELPVPDPLEGYNTLSYGNSKKVTTNQPYIRISSTRRGTSVTTSTKQVSWAQYMTDPTLVQSEIKFDAPGKYDVEILGNDYKHEVTCTGCVAILDKFRPRFDTSGSCPTSLATPQTLTKNTLTAFQNYDAAYTTYTADTNIVNNPNSGPICYNATTDRISRVKLFVESEKACSTTCFDDTTLATNVAKLKSSPLTSNLQDSYATLETSLNAQCTWCCKKNKILKEMYTPYTCPTDYDNDPKTPSPMCAIGSGIPNTCSINVCLQAKGTDIITAAVSIKSSIQAASNGVLAALPSKPAGSDTTKNIYYSIPCTTFNKNNTDCSYTVKLSRLLDVTTGFKTTFPTPTAELTNVKDFIFWRFNINGANFATWNPLDDTAITFTDPNTTVVLEAWTACGRAYSTTFTVNLFLRSTLSCTKFPAMWKIVEKPGVQGTEGCYCAYSGSDFAILGLNMTVADVLQQSDPVPTSVKCDIMVKPTCGSDTQVVTLVNDSSSATISKYYAIDLVNNPTTAPKTTGTIHCKFTRTPRTNGQVISTTNNTIDCSHTFSITDCDKPEIIPDAEVEDVCAAQCANDPAPGVYEACGGSIVSSSATETIIKPSVVQKCCSKCDTAMACNSVGSTGIKRCEPVSTYLLLAENVEEGVSTATTSMMVLLGAGAMMAIAAIGVVIAHFKTFKRVDLGQDAYYPLLEEDSLST